MMSWTQRQNLFNGVLGGVFVMVCTIGQSTFAQDNGSNGGLFIEPSVTYEVSDTSVNYPSPFSNSEGSSDGLGLGAVLGFHIADALYLGLDARYSMPKFKDSSVGYDASAKSTNWGPVLGLQMPVVGLRVWGSAILGGELDPDSSGSLDVKFSEATGYRVGAGFRVLFVSVNLEYQEIEYDETSLQQVGPFTPGTFGGVDLENKSWIASVSFPLAL